MANRKRTTPKTINNLNTGPRDLLLEKPPRYGLLINFYGHFAGSGERQSRNVRHLATFIMIFNQYRFNFAGAPSKQNKLIALYSLDLCKYLLYI